MTNVLTNILAFAFALGVIIVVHEAGHLLVAKAFGVRVLTFSVGFGKRLWSFRRGETEYRLSAVPLGGYVRLGGESTDDATGDPREFLSKPRWQRVLVYLAGPLMNVILAIALFTALFMVGIEVMNLPEMPPVIGGVEEGSPAEKAGLRRGDIIAAVKGEPVDDWQEVLMVLVTSPNKPVALDIRRGEQTFQATVTPRQDANYAGDSGGIFPAIRPQIIKVVPGSPAEKAGFQPGDEIRAVNGMPVSDQRDFIGHIEKFPGGQVTLQIVRDGRMEMVQVVPRNEGGVGRIGVQIGFFQRYGFSRAVQESAKYNVQIVRDTFSILGKIFTQEVSAKGALAGPIEIAAQSGAAARTGFKHLLHLMGFISISIAIMNLLPIPILDGGQIFILLVEEVIRRDLPLRLKEVISQVGFVMILLLMFVVIWFDLMKNLPKGLIPGT